MKRNYSINNPHCMCNTVHKSLLFLKITGTATSIVDISNLSTILSSEYYDTVYNVIR